MPLPCVNVPLCLSMLIVYALCHKALMERNLSFFVILEQKGSFMCNVRVFVSHTQHTHKAKMPLELPFKAWLRTDGHDPCTALILHQMLAQEALT